MRPKPLTLSPSRSVRPFAQKKKNDSVRSSAFIYLANIFVFLAAKSLSKSLVAHGRLNRREVANAGDSGTVS